MVVVVVVERMCRRTSAGIAVPATTPIKISRPDVNYRLESFAPKDREKRVKDYIGMTKKQKRAFRDRENSSRGRNGNRNAKKDRHQSRERDDLEIFFLFSFGAHTRTQV